MNSETWQVPTSFPQVPPNATIAVDTETYCEDLGDKGPQFLYGKDYVIGISLAMEDGYAQYFPIAHSANNCNLPVVEWFKELLERPDITAIGANWKFDQEGLYKLGILPKCKLVDMQVTDALLDENQTSYSLNSIAKRRGFGEKTPGEMEEQLVKQGYIKRGKPDWTMLHKLHPKYVGPYAADDARLTLLCHMQQRTEIQDQNLNDVYELESKLIPILFDMRRVGQPIDIDAADELNSTMGINLEDQFAAIVKDTNAPWLDPFSSQSLSTWVKGLGYMPPQVLRYGKNGTNYSESVTNEWMLATENRHIVEMAKYRQGERFRRDVIEGVLIDQSHNGRIHASWYSTRGTSFMAGEDGGTRSGRLSSGSPSLQVMPSRHPEHGPILRRMFIPEQKCRFFKGDYNSQEVRIAVHFAYLLKLTGAQELVARYNENPHFDYHTHVQSLLNTVLSKPIDRGIAKTTGLSLQYGMGKARLADRLDMKVTETVTFLDIFNKEIPWIKEALYKAQNIAVERGYVRSILGRRRRFDEWENANYGASWSKPIADKREALITFGKVRRAGTYKAWNSVIQGSAAEMTKTAMVHLYEAGILPTMSIHDELTASLETEAKAKQMKEIMENAVKLVIPVIVDSSLADNWAGDNKEVIE